MSQFHHLVKTQPAQVTALNLPPNTSCVLLKKRTISVEATPLPILQPDGVLVKVISTGELGSFCEFSSSVGPASLLLPSSWLPDLCFVPHRPPSPVVVRQRSRVPHSQSLASDRSLLLRILVYSCTPYNPFRDNPPDDPHPPTDQTGLRAEPS
jgi:hypothetical protein